VPAAVLSVSNSCLDMFIHTTSGVHQVAAPVPPGAAGYTGQLYGRYVVRFKSDSLQGYKTAWLLWPTSNTWPRDGEIDFPEGDLDTFMSAYQHNQGATLGSDVEGFTDVGSQSYTSWHTATLEWMPNYVRFDMDGNGFGSTWNRVPNTTMYHVLQTETTLNGFAPADATNGHVLVDWYAAYSFDSAYTPPQTIGCWMLPEATQNTAVFSVPTIANGGVPTGSTAAVSGDLLTVALATWSASVVSPPAGWTQIGSTQSFTTSTGYVFEMRVYQRTWDGTTASYTFTTTGTAWTAGAMVANHSAVFDVFGGQTNATAGFTLAAPSVTTTDADALLYFTAVGDSSLGPTLDRPRQMGWLGASTTMIVNVEPRMPGATGTRVGASSGSVQSIGVLVGLK
jgi:hypothetical protein